jgi:hypothetical protein
MTRLILVAASAAAMVVFVLLHKSAGALIVGIVVGTPFFLRAVTNGAGTAQLRLGKGAATDPSAAIGMGLAAAGIAAASFSDVEYPAQFRYFFAGCFVVGLCLALYHAARAVRGQNPTKIQADGPSGVDRS